MSNYVIGLDFGTDSVRALVVETGTGKEISTGVAHYSRWKKGEYTEPLRNQFRQHPLDYLEAMEESIKIALEPCDENIKKNIKGIGIDTTGSTPCAIDESGTPLALREDFKDEPDAMFILWKDHTAVQEAAEINDKAKNWGGIDFTKYEGGVYSSEWFWAKLLHVLRKNEKVRKAAFSWVEHCDWITALLAGNTKPLEIKRSRCAAGHKAMWHEDWGGLPDDEFLNDLDPLLHRLKERLYKDTYTSDEKAGNLCEKWAKKLGLKEGIAIAVGAFDAHMGAVGGGVKERTLVKIMGTSTCDILVVSKDMINNKLIKGICGQVDGSVIPGLIGLEAGQSAFGDVYAWFKDLLSWPLEAILPEVNNLNKNKDIRIKEEIESKILIKLREEAEKLDPDNTTLLALDWLNGRRSPFADQTLTGAILGLSLGTNAPLIFKALVEATAFGSRAINEQFLKEGLDIDEIIAMGGIPKKDRFVMQVTTDILNKPVKVAASDETCALGASMFAAVAAGIYKDITDAQKAMLSGFSKTYYPKKSNVDKYNELYNLYISLGKDLEKYLRKL
jgi:L-ribulokinase